MTQKKKITRYNIAVGDVVEFKSDIEQAGRVIKIVRDDIWVQALTDEGFDGDYIGGQTDTIIDRRDVFTDE